MNFTERQVKAWIVATAATLAEDGVVTPELTQEVEDQFLEDPAVPNEVVAEVIPVLQEEVDKIV
jgi:hypothetical protein